jgi:hypothetical protein
VYQVIACGLFSSGVSGSLLGPRDHDFGVCGSTSGWRGGLMSELVRFGLDGDASVLVEVDDSSLPGLQRVGRGQDGIVEAGRRLNDALAGVREAAHESVRMLRSLSPDECELEFGVKFAGEAGAVIAKTSTEGHFIVKLSWARRNLASDGDQ